MFSIVALIVAGAACSLPTQVPPASTASPKVDLASVAQGGLLYDKWWMEVPKASEPKGDHPLWASQSTNKSTGSATWRCKECHGWDYKGKDGAYGKGRRYTGFSGAWDAAQKKTVAEIAAFLGDRANPKHNAFTAFRPADIADLANFLKYGVVDMAKYVDYATKKPIGADAARGKSAYDKLCAVCHGADGKKLNFGDASKPEYVGTLAKDNPQEFLHKTWVGQPGSQPPMPSALVSGWRIEQVVDVLAYAQTLPEK
jgi:thiosulfate dehydrogenase